MSYAKLGTGSVIVRVCPPLVRIARPIRLQRWCAHVKDVVVKPLALAGIYPLPLTHQQPDRADAQQTDRPRLRDHTGSGESPPRLGDLRDSAITASPPASAS